MFRIKYRQLMMACIAAIMIILKYLSLKNVQLEISNTMVGDTFICLIITEFVLFNII